MLEREVVPTRIMHQLADWHPFVVHREHRGIAAGDPVVVMYDTFPQPTVRIGRCEGWRQWYGDDWQCLVKYDGTRKFIAKVRAPHVMSRHLYERITEYAKHDTAYTTALMLKWVRNAKQRGAWDSPAAWGFVQ